MAKSFKTTNDATDEIIQEAKDTATEKKASGRPPLRREIRSEILHVKITPTLKRRLQECADLDTTTMSYVVDRALNAYFKEKGI